MDSIDCLLCASAADIIGIGHCNHKPFCYRCMIKLRCLNKNKQCPICKQDQDHIILTNNHNANFQDFKIPTLKPLSAFTKSQKDNATILCADDQIHQLVDGLNKVKCLVPDCKTEPNEYKTMRELSHHLKEIHARYLCEICLDFKTCFLSEQILYNDYYLRKHINNGDFDDDSNIIFKHPYCSFCNKHFYDEDKFKVHLHSAHYSCDMCENRKYTFYRDHASFEKHLRLSHFFCEEQACKDQMKVFKTQSELEIHMQNCHAHNQKVKGITKHLGIQLTGFGSEDKKQQQRSHDREGHDFSDQFISLLQTHLHAVAKVDEHKDETLDPRDFYYRDYNEDQDRNLDYSERDHAIKQTHFEDTVLYRPYTIPSLQFDSFIKKCQKLVYKERIEEELRRWVQGLEQQKYQPQNFVFDFVNKFGPKTGFRLLAFFMVCREMKARRDLLQALDAVVLEHMLQLPKRNANVVFASKKYSNLFLNLMKHMNLNISERIKNGTLTKFEDTIMPKERIFQFVEILRHIRTQEMGKFKFALNFGLQPLTLEHVKNNVLLDDESRIQDHLHKISNQELIPLYLYVNLCQRMLLGQQVHKEMNEVNECVYADFFVEFPDLLASLSNRSKFSEKQGRYESGAQGQKQKQKQRARLYQEGVQLKEEDFPTLKETKAVPAKNVSSKWNQPNCLLITQSKPNALQELFPSLEEVQQQKPQSSQQQQQQPKKKQQQQQTFGTNFLDDDAFPSLEPPGPPRTLEGTDWNPNGPKLSDQMQVIGSQKKRGKVTTKIAGGFF